MPTPIMHLALAEEILHRGHLPPAIRRLLIQQRGPFLLGNTAPDVQTVSGQARDETHFYTIPLTSDRPAHETLFAAHPQLAHAGPLPPAQVAFVAGYIAHLLLDELWLIDIFQRYFLWDWGPRRERMFLHNVLRTWMDRQDQPRLNGSLIVALRRTEPQGWLPFVADEHLQAWRDWLVEQLVPGHTVRTAEVFAQRMGVPVAQVEIVLSSPQQMEERVFRRVPPSALQAFHDVGYARSVALIDRYVTELVNR
jgi:hypothetical protein